MTTLHSPLPFGEPMLHDESGVYHVRDAYGRRTVCAYNAADAIFVRRACNNHEALLAAAKLAALCFKRSQGSGAFLGDDEHEAWSALNAAIALVEAG